LKHRCPWCGEFAKTPRIIYFPGAKCPHCNNNYKAYRKTLLYLLYFPPFAFAYIFIFSQSSFNNMPKLLCLFLFILSFILLHFVSLLLVYEKDTEKYVKEIQNKAYLAFYPLEIFTYYGQKQRNFPDMFCR